MRRSTSRHDKSSRGRHIGSYEQTQLQQTEDLKLRGIVLAGYGAEMRTGQ